MSDEPKKKRGRPSKSKEERKDTNLTFRVAPDLRYWLEREAEVTRRSVSAQIEHVLYQRVHSFKKENDLAWFVANAIRMAEVRLARSCYADEDAARMCLVAGETALAIAFGQTTSLEVEWSSLTDKLAKANEIGKSEEIKALLDEMKGAIARFREEVLLAHEVAIKCREKLKQFL